MNTRLAVAIGICVTFTLSVVGFVIWTADCITGEWWPGPLIIALIVCAGAIKWAVEVLEDWTYRQ